jgi:hypothetical protein
MLKYSFPLVPNNISWYIINISDRIIVSSFLGSSVNGVYAMANKFPNIMNNFSSFFFTAFKENVAIAVKKDSYEKFINLISPYIVPSMKYKLYLGYNNKPDILSKEAWDYQKYLQSAIALTGNAEG